MAKYDNDSRLADWTGTGLHTAAEPCHTTLHCFILIYLSISRVLAYFMNVFKDLHGYYHDNSSGRLRIQIAVNYHQIHDRVDCKSCTRGGLIDKSKRVYTFEF